MQTPAQAYVPGMTWLHSVVDSYPEGSCNQTTRWEGPDQMEPNKIPIKTTEPSWYVMHVDTSTRPAKIWREYYLESTCATPQTWFEEGRKNPEVPQHMTDTCYGHGGIWTKWVVDEWPTAPPTAAPTAAPTEDTSSSSASVVSPLRTFTFTAAAAMAAALLL